MKVVNFFVKLISSLFILIFGLLCLTTTVFLLIKNMTSQENITNYVKNANIFDYSSRDIISDSQNSTLRKTITNELLAMDIPPLVVDEVIDSPELDILISDYIYEYSRYILYNENKPVFPSDGILNVLIDKYKTQQYKDLSEKQKEKALQYIKLLGNDVDQGILEKSEIDEMISLKIIKQIAMVFASQFMPTVLCIVIITLIAIISICLGSIKKAINWCSKITILNGLLLIIASFVEVRVLIMYFNNQGLIDSLIISIVENGFQNMLIYGVILIIVGLLFMTISAILLKKENKNKNLNMVDNSEEQINSYEEQIDNSEKIINKPKIKSTEILQEIKEVADVEEQQPKENDSKQKPEKEVKAKDNENKIDDKNNFKEEMQIVPTVEEEKEEPEEVSVSEIEIEEAIKNEDEDPEVEEPTEEYREISDEKSEPEQIKKEDKNIAPLKEVNIEVTQPKKGKEIEFNPDAEKNEEDIEVL